MAARSNFSSSSQFLFVFTTCRSEKESLQCSLLEAQQLVAELEKARSHLEARLGTATQAKEVLQGESLVRFVSGDAPAWCSCSEASSARRASPCLKLKGLEVSRVCCLCSR